MADRTKIKNPLALALLGLLLERPMHPYEMATTLRERYKDRTFKVNTGSLYDTVARLAEHGWIAASATERTGNRPERTVYGLTDLGRAEFTDWLDALLRNPVKEFPQFLAAVSYLGALEPERAREALEARAGQLEKTATQIRATLEEVLAGGLPRLFMIEVECALRLLDAELAWVRETAAEIAAGTLAWPDR
ncbi:PadR family transcriptional regulator [Saccharothrix violaceirubra]|uniref:DNA-binding PadR family transcriptional regulator n=1 Tax=Saccharothrix violaceirubra TaxID=413306 RepID=A0A7W7T852_9PSEU|nr:PadR family transcriptional regulator [Saccharothrix violaceirubra]MBB4967752.1 DNA-binding PadR family transcriptional regulator [Saccharothrix violaceirubra]